MASSSGPLNEELHCSICLDVFTDPVITPCGHNFCRTCLDNCWTNTQTCCCPSCNEKFSRRPDLKISTTSGTIKGEKVRMVQVALLREGSNRTQHLKEKLNLGRSEVFCDICDERKQKAVKSCLTCQSSYCETHLEPHHRVPRLKKHKLVNAVENLEDYICQKHERPLEVFCRDDQTCVCLFCTEGDHRNHNTVPIEEESQQKKTQTDVQQMIQNRMKKIQEIQHSVEKRKRNTEKEKSASVELFTDLICSIERCQSELLKMMEEQQKAAEKQAEDLIKELQQEITDLKRRNTELEQLSHTDDHLYLLQTFSSLYSRPHKNWTEISIDSDVNVLPMNRALTLVKKTHETLSKKLSQTALKFVQKFAVDVTLDPDTAHPYLILSDDGKQVRHGDIEPEKRFDVGLCVLANEGFSSGRFYYEVQVKGKTEWILGVAKESINRKGETTLTPEDGYWTVIVKNENHYIVFDNPIVLFPQRGKPKIVGVFVDYEEGLVSFYDVGHRSHIYSFTGQTFTDKLYPYFSPGLNEEGKNSNPLIITPVQKTINSSRI
ncbi:E3 ubiquitin-protein ligase TRIM39-like [Labeo rohita]|uniref:E3 ubiquitin-protein ligase TRIM39-like n=1 Tax=Labeo rohita TaxID=84645 RepID=UPI0021E325C1|nr:E3 ubiquitin-protein ligase TRIM39-like [Labeo rohita]